MEHDLPGQESGDPSNVRERTNLVGVDPRQLSDATGLRERPHRVDPPQYQLTAECIPLWISRGNAAFSLLIDEVVVRRREEEGKDRVATHFVDAEAVAGHAGRVTDVEELREPRLFGKHDVPQVERSIVVLRDEADGGRRPVLLRSLLSVPLRFPGLLTKILGCLLGQLLILLVVLVSLGSVAIVSDVVTVVLRDAIREGLFQREHIALGVEEVHAGAHGHGVAERDRVGDTGRERDLRLTERA